MLIEKILSDEIPDAVLLIKSVFNEFIAGDYSPEGTAQFYSFIDEETMKKRLESGSLMLLARENNTVVGFFEMREGDHIPLFFVKGDCHGKGVGRSLFNTALKICSGINSETERITVNSFPRAVSFYKSLGFRQSAAMQIRSGITFYPMQYFLKK